ncbi:MAG TPA: alpha/beta hydrolase [Stellaceae bacterium]
MSIAAAGFERTSVNLPAGTVSYFVGGSGRPVLYLHSAGGVRMTQPLQDLAARFRIFMPIVPGFDGTDWLPGITTMTDLAGLMAAFATAAIGEPCDVIGHSFGGYLALWLTVLHPKSVGQLVLESPAGFQPPDAPAFPTDPTELLRRAFAHPERLQPQAEDPSLALANLGTARAYMAGIGMDHALMARLGEIGCLTLIVQGTKDGILAPDGARAIKSRIRRSHLIFVYDAAHVIETDQPARFTALVGDFLGRAEGFLVNWTGHAAAGAV